MEKNIKFFTNISQVVQNFFKTKNYNKSSKIGVKFILGGGAMNKKIMSFVLAMVLSVGLGVANLFAGNTYLGGSVAAGYANDNQGVAPEGGEGSKSKGVWIKIGSKNDTLSGNLTGVYSYYAGIGTEIQQAGGIFTIKDSFSQIVAQLTNAEGNWTVKYLATRQADLATMPDPKDYVETDENGELKKDKDGNYIFKSEAAKKEFTDLMKSWFLDRGYKEEQLRVAETDENGNLIDKDGKIIDGEDDKAIQWHELSADFYVQFRSELGKGLDHSVALQSGDGKQGPTAIVMVGGNTAYTFISSYPGQETNGYDASNNTYPTGEESYSVAPTGIRVTSECEYFKEGEAWAGMLKGTRSYGLLATGEQTEIDGEKYEKYEWRMSYSASSYEEKTYKDSKGVEHTYYERTDYTINGLDVSIDDAHLEAAIKAVQNDYAHGNPANSSDLATGDNGYTVTSYTSTTYSNNMTRETQYDSSTQNVTHFVAGSQVSYVENKEHTQTYVAMFSANMVQMGFKQLTGVDESGTTGAWQTTLCDKWGVSKGVINGDYLSEEKYEEGLGLIEDAKNAIASGNFAALEGSNVEMIYLTADEITGPGKANFMKYFGWTQVDIDNMLNFNYGDGPVAQVSLKYNESIADDTGAVYEGDVTTNKSYTSAGTHTYHQTLTSSKKLKGWTFESTILIGGAAAYSKTQNVITGGEVDMLIESDPAVEGVLFPELSDEELIALGIDPEDEEDIKANKDKIEARKEEKLKEKAAELGIEQYDEDGNETQAYKDLKEGFYTDSNGQTYAIVNANTINIMDGEGFHAAEGETIMVVVDKTTKDKIIENGDKRIMFMGGIRQSTFKGENGDKEYLVMAMNTSYSGGYAQGDEIEGIKTAISEVSRLAAAGDIEGANAAYNKYVEDGVLTANEEGTNWIANNTEDNIYKFSLAKFSWSDDSDDNRTVAQKLFNAWQALF